MIGLVNLYKPQGMTSSDAVVKVRKILGTRSVGHMGTLDPQGEGVLIMGIGKATRLFNYLLSKDKIYEAEFTFGEETTTLDREGEITASGGKIPSFNEINEKILSFIGVQSQIPPKYSAKKIDGQTAYKRARNGEDFVLNACTIEVYDFQLLNMNNNSIKVRIHCSSGTYIRSLCRDLAYSLNTYAIMTAIKRIKCGSFNIENAVSLDCLNKDNLLSVQEALPEIERIDLPDEYYKYLSNGMNVKFDRSGKFLVFCKNEMFGLGESKNGYIKITVYMRENV